jgi:hypothetical protein
MPRPFELSLSVAGFLNQNGYAPEASMILAAVAPAVDVNDDGAHSNFTGTIEQFEVICGDRQEDVQWGEIPDKVPEFPRETPWNTGGKSSASFSTSAMVAIGPSLVSTASKARTHQNHIKNRETVTCLPVGAMPSGLARMAPPCAKSSGERKTSLSTSLTPASTLPSLPFGP